MWHRGTLGERDSMGQAKKRQRKRLRRGKARGWVNAPQPRREARPWAWPGALKRAHTADDLKLQREVEAEKVQTLRAGGVGWRRARLLARKIIDNLVAPAQLAVGIQRCAFRVAPSKANPKPGPCGGRLKRRAVTVTVDGLSHLVVGGECRQCGRVWVPEAQQAAAS